MMSLVTTLLALIPSSEVIGGFAFFLFFACRVMQSSEVENLLHHYEVGEQLGSLLGAIVGSLIAYASVDAISGYGV